MKKIKLFYDSKVGEIFYQGENVIALQRDNQSCCLMGIEHYIGRGAGIIVYNASKTIARKRFFEKVKGLKKEPPDIMKTVLDHLSMCGFGLFEIKSFGKEAVIELRNSFNALGHSSEKPRCYTMAGYLAGIMELITGKECMCVEEKCIAKRDRVCKFRINILPSEEDVKPIKDFWKSKSIPRGAEESFVEYDEKKGETIFQGVTSCLMLAAPERAEFQNEIKKIVGPAYKTIMYESSGKIPTMESVTMTQKLMIKVFGAISKRKIIYRLIKEFSERGLGAPRIMELNEKKNTIRIIVRNSHFAKWYKKSKEPVCYGMAGCFAGGAEIVFGRRMRCKETKCVAKGDKHCDFEIFPEKK